MSSVTSPSPLPSTAPTAASPPAANYENRFARIEADLLMLKWMTGTILGGVVALVIKSFIA